MKKIYLLLLLLLIFVSVRISLGQACGGSLGEPVVRQTFPSTGALPAGSTNYTYTSNNCPPDGSYRVGLLSGVCFGSWYAPADHTVGGGTNYMVINAAYTAGEFFKQTATGLCPGTYELSAYIFNLLYPTACTGNPQRFPNITFRIEKTDGTLIKTFSTGSITTSNAWIRQATFFTTTESTVVLKLINNAPGGCGNDLLLDDIEFRPCGPTVAASIAGSTTKCVGQSSSLSSSLSAGYTTPQYQWQVSTNNVTFTDIAGATSPTYTPTHTTVGTFYYRMLASENGNITSAKCRVVSNAITVTVNAIPAAPTVPPLVAYCKNASASALTATGSNLLWYGTAATGGSSSGTAPTPSTATVGTTNYYVSQTVNTCESPRAAIPVVINPLPILSVVVGNASCPMGATGSVIVNATDGTPGYT